MKYRVTHCPKNHAEISGKLVGIGFESPSKNGLLEIDSAYNVSMWITHRLLESPSIVVDTGTEVTEYPPNINRPDVKDHFDKIGVTDIKISGFYVNLKPLTGFKIKIKIDTEYIEAWRFDPISENRDLRLALEYYHGFCGNMDSILLQNFQPIKKMSFEDFSFHSLDDLPSLKLYNGLFTNEKVLRGCLEELRDPLWNINAILSSIDSGHLSIKSFFSGNEVFCEKSVTVDDFNFLLFYEQNIPFFLVQHIDVACIIFPTLLVVINLSVMQWSTTAIEKLKRVYLKKACLKNPRGSDLGNFLGLHISQSRPYHTIYDVLQGMYLLNSRLPIDKGLKIFVNDGMSFFPDEVYSSLFPASAISYQHYFDEIVDLDGGYTLFPSVQYSKTNNREAISAIASLLRSSNDSLISVDMSGAECIIWIGVSTEKRSWVEQLEGWENILNHLSASQTVLAVIDGITFPTKEFEYNRKTSDNEDEIFRYLKLHCPKVKFISTIGKKAKEKISIATKVDLFVTSYATDSIYPSCIAKRPGVVYSPHQIGSGKQLHIHHDIIELDQSKVLSIPNGKGTSWDQMSVSIDWREILKLVEKRLISDSNSNRGNNL